MRLRPPRSALVLVLAASVLSCSENPINPRSAAPPSPRADAAGGGSTPWLLISQVYGGGGNSGSTYRNDFIELHNVGAAAVSLAGMSVQYASAAGSSWQVTPLSGTIEPGAYFLVQEAKGSGGTVDLPTPDVAGGIAMGASGGKVALASSTTALRGTCPTGGVIEAVSFGSATDCGYGHTPAPNNSHAVLRQDEGCQRTGDLAADFVVETPLPRNTATAAHACPAPGPLDHVLVRPAAVTLTAGGTAQLAAIPRDAADAMLWTATVTWSSSDEDVATVDGSGLVTAQSASAAPVTITATAEESGTTRTATTAVTVNPLGAIGWVDLSSSSSSFPPGFQTQLFATARDMKGGQEIPASFTFEALDPQIATIATVQNSAIVSAVSAPGDTANRPGFRVTATPLSGTGSAYTFVTHSITVEPPQPVDPSIYGRNDEFGDPSPASPADADDMLIVRPQYTLSYNQSRGTPNWVAYELDARQLGGQDRCNCFTADPLLPPAKQIFTSDYTSGGYDRGHMAKSADRTATNLDNAATFYLTNIVPQTADLNQGVWASFENALSDSARAGRAVYVVTGPIYSGPLTFLKNEGKVAIPDRTWKVAFIGPREGALPFGRTTLQSWADMDVTLLAVDMPNVAGVRNDPWSKYLTTVDALEDATGYDILSLLAAPFQDVLEAGDHRPVADFSVGGALQEGAALTFDASASTDPDLGRTLLGHPESLTYAWLFSDGDSARGKVVTHTFADDGSFSAKLTVTDAFGWPASAKQAVAIANVAPTVTFGATSLAIVSGDSVFGRFGDPGADAPWHALMDWGNGRSSASTWSVPGLPIAAASAGLATGSYTLTLAVTDKDGATGSAAVDVTIAGRPVPGAALPRSISAAETDGDIRITLFSAPRADVATLHPASVAIGAVGLDPGKKVRIADYARTGTAVTLRFARQALIDAGLLTRATTGLVVTGTLADGVRIVAHVPVNVH